MTAIDVNNMHNTKIEGFVMLFVLPSIAGFPSPWTLLSDLQGNARFSSSRSASAPIGYNNLPLDNSTAVLHKDRFQRTATQNAATEKECILTIDGVSLNITQWAKAHPGGVNILRRFHNKDASKPFHAADHSAHAYAILKDFPVVKRENYTESEMTEVSTTPRLRCPIIQPQKARPRRPRWQQKLFTKEDPIGVHKYLGIFCLVHFAFRFLQMYFFDPSAGLGTRQGRGPHIATALCLPAHALLSLSSLIFNTVPRERVVGQPMIWQEYRVHNIAFGLRSVICTFLAWWSIYKNHAAPWRRLAVVGSCLTALSTSLVADVATRKLRSNPTESTTATMPYWDGCSPTREKATKLFYAYSQWMATVGCIAVCNPAWPLAILFPIQQASFLMTLVRKGFLSTKGSHMAYMVGLILPFLVGVRSMCFMQETWKLPCMMVGAAVLFQLRRFGINKYLLWLPVYAVRILWGDRFIPYDIW